VLSFILIVYEIVKISKKRIKHTINQRTEIIAANISTIFLSAKKSLLKNVKIVQMNEY
jgi:F0F1-type ATP synthase membrane subunit b/b'